MDPLSRPIAQGGACGLVISPTPTATWYAYRITDTEFGVFDTSTVDIAARGADEHPVLRRLTDEHLACAPRVEHFGVVAAKV